jgi:hypothetical protein
VETHQLVSCTENHQMNLTSYIKHLYCLYIEYQGINVLDMVGRCIVISVTPVATALFDKFIVGMPVFQFRSCSMLAVLYPFNCLKIHC